MPPVFSKETDKIYIINSSRKGQGRTSPCENACPLGNPIQKMEREIAAGNVGQALRIIRASNPFPGITGRVCPHPCEDRCNRGQYDEKISIRALERHVADSGAAFRDAFVPAPASGKKLAIIGSGPAGLACAFYSSLLGHSVTVFEAAPVAGGVPRQSIPDFRLPKDVVDREAGMVLALGVRILTNVEVGVDISLEEILRRHDACLVAVGNRRERRLDIPGIGKALPAVSFLKQSNLGRTSMDRKKVVILGGGGVAFDCAFTARRLGAASVDIVCLESRGAMRVPAAEIDQADAEGIPLHNNYLAAAIELDENDTPISVLADGVSGFCFDESGALKADFVPDDKLRLNADVVICASGLMPDLSLLDGACAQMVEKTPRGCLKTSNSQTSVAGLFAAGECALGPALVSTAIASGRQAAFDMDRWLRGEDLASPIDAWIDEVGGIATARAKKAPSVHEVAFEEIVNIGKHPRGSRKQTSRLTAVDTWLAFEELDKGFDSAGAQAEAERCLHCGHCQMCGECVASCPGLILAEGEGSPRVAYPDECWHCGCCRLACPGACISFKFPLHTFL